MARLRQLAQAALPWLALATAAVAATRFAGDALWPCPVSCQGGGHYQRLWGVPVHAPAVAGLLAVAVLAWLRRPAFAAVAAWACAGASLYFLWVAWQLGLRCSYCFTVHAGVLLAALCAGAVPAGALARAAAAAIAFLGLHFAFHPGVVEDIDAPAPTAPAGGDAGVSAFLGTPATGQVTPGDQPGLAAVLVSGRDDAPWRVEVAIDLQCPHCAAAFAPLDAVLRTAAAEGRAQVRWRFLTRRSAPGGRELAARVLAAAGRPEAERLVALLLGTPEDRGWAEVRARVAEAADPAALDAALAARRAEIDAQLDADGQRLRALGMRSTPAVVATRRADGAQRRWLAAEADPARIAEALR
jgi:protein-disulfide isomerase